MFGGKDENALKAGRALALGCITPVMIISFTFCGLYWGMWAQAQDANDAASKIAPALFTDDWPYYDTCGNGIGMELAGLELTGWGVILAYASILYLLMGICTICLAISYFVPFFAFFSACGLCCGQCAHFALIIVTAVLRFSDSSEQCAKRTTRILVDEDTTWEDHGNKIKNLFISQCVLYCFYSCCVGFGLQLSIGFAMIKFGGNRG